MEDNELGEAKHMLQVTTFADTALVMCGLLARRLQQLGQLDEDTATHLRNLLQHATRSVEDCDPLAVRTLEKVESWLE